MSEPEKTYDVAAPSGKVWTLRPLPKHFYIYYGQLPTLMTETVAEALKKGDSAAVEQAVIESLSPDEMVAAMTFIRDAIQYACANPKISLTPKDETEISPFQIAPEDFDFLATAVMQGGGSFGLQMFPQKSAQTIANRNDGAKVRKTAERPARHRK